MPPIYEPKPISNTLDYFQRFILAKHKGEKPEMVWSYKRSPPEFRQFLDYVAKRWDKISLDEAVKQIEATQNNKEEVSQIILRIISEVKADMRKSNGRPDVASINGEQITVIRYKIKLNDHVYEENRDLGKMVEGYFPEPTLITVGERVNLPFILEPLLTTVVGSEYDFAAREKIGVFREVKIPIPKKWHYFMTKKQKEDYEAKIRAEVRGQYRTLQIHNLQKASSTP
ncbi:MAG: hypothetical protein QW331_04315 [Candidatus Woesearchaeota archaeon]